MNIRMRNIKGGRTSGERLRESQRMKENFQDVDSAQKENNRFYDIVQSITSGGEIDVVVFVFAAGVWHHGMGIDWGKIIFVLNWKRIQLNPYASHALRMNSATP